MPRERKEPSPDQIEKEMARIDDLVNQLKKFEPTPDKESPVVNQALGFVRKEFSGHPEWLPVGTIAQYHGSLQYHDFRNLDLDLSIVGQVSTENTWNAAIAVGDYFDGNAGWPGPVPCIGNTVSSGIANIANDAPYYSPRALEEENNISPVEASTILTGKLLFDTPDQQRLLSYFQGQIKDIARQQGNSTFRRAIISNLIDVQRIRRERRGMSTRVR